MGTPFELDPIVDDDLRYASYVSATWGLEARMKRQRGVGLLAELSSRWQSVTDKLVESQPWEVARATKGRRVGLIGLLAMLVDWPDPTFMRDMVFGFPAVGFSPNVPAFAAQEAEWMSLEEVWNGAEEDAVRIVRRLGPSEFDEAIVEAGEKDEKLGFCGEAMSWSELLSCNHRFRLIRRFCIQQPGGKLRVIDDAADGGQSALSMDANKLDLCTAVQPGLHVRLLWHAFKAIHPDWFLNDCFVTGGEDLPNAYRHVPMRPEESWACIVAYYDPVRGPCFRRYFGMLFGLPLAVTSFNRFPRLLQACCRRLGACLASLYFDDLTVQDVKSSRGSSQWFCTELARLLGSPFSSEKHQPMQAEGDFLGLWHSVGLAVPQGGVTFWVRERLSLKILSMIQEAYRVGHLHPGVAAKIFGCLTFLSHGCWGKVGRAGLNAIQERQYAPKTEVGLTGAILSCFEMVKGLLELKPQRLLSLDPSQVQRILVASDAAQDGFRIGSAGALVVTPDLHRHALVMQVDDSLFDVWDNQPTKISQLELCIVLMGLASMAEAFRGRHGLWFVDNVAALMSLIKGRSNTVELDIMAGAVHAALCGLNSAIYFEWIASKDNWSDGVSRDGADDVWLQRHGFQCHFIKPFLFLIKLPYLVIMKIFSFV